MQFLVGFCLFRFVLWLVCEQLSCACELVCAERICYFSSIDFVYLLWSFVYMRCMPVVVAACVVVAVVAVVVAAVCQRRFTYAAKMCK